MDEHHLSPEAWLQRIREDYLTTYMKEGGASVKIVVAEADVRAQVRDQLSAIAASDGFQYAHVDAANRRVHLVQNLFTAVAGQISWEELATAFLRQALSESIIAHRHRGASRLKT